jgi:hypothetical protein
VLPMHPAPLCTRSAAGLPPDQQRPPLGPSPSPSPLFPRAVAPAAAGAPAKPPGRRSCRRSCAAEKPNNAQLHWPPTRNASGRGDGGGWRPILPKQPISLRAPAAVPVRRRATISCAVVPCWRPARARRGGAHVRRAWVTRRGGEIRNQSGREQHAEHRAFGAWRNRSNRSNRSTARTRRGRTGVSPTLMAAHGVQRVRSERAASAP